MNRFAVGILAVLIGAATGACASGRFAPRTLEQDEREVMLAVIQYMRSEEDGEPEPVVARMTTNEIEGHLIPDAEVLEEAEIRFPLEVFPDVVRRSRSRAPLGRLIGDTTRIRWITEAQVDSVLSAPGPGVDAGERLFQQMFPGARSITWLSRAGFDEPRRHASVVYGMWCGALCGTAGVFLLEHRSGRWRVIDRLGMIIS